MGKRRFEQRILAEDTIKDRYKISKAYEVTDKREFVQFMTTLDKKPAHLGGRCNDWRELSLSSNQKITSDHLAREEWLDYDFSNKSESAVPQVPIKPAKYKAFTKFSKSKEKILRINLEDLGPDFDMLFNWASSLDESDFLADFYHKD